MEFKPGDLVQYNNPDHPNDRCIGTVLEPPRRVDFFELTTVVWFDRKGLDYELTEHLIKVSESK